MGVSKVVYGNDTLVDLTGDTVTPTSLTLGATAHAANGERIVGEYQYVLPPMSSDIRGGARIQPDSGLEITDTDNLRVRLALESDGTVRGGIAELTAKGHAEQVSTTGKNLCPRYEEFSKGGLTFTVCDDGSIYVGAGTSTQFITQPTSFITLAAGTYTLSGCPSGGGETTYRLDARTDISTVVSGSFDTGSGATFTLAEETSVAVCIRIPNNATIPTGGITFYPQLELGSTATEYEPYTGGAPSPSPEFPQEIQVVRGRNLLDESTWINDGRIPATSNGTLVSSSVSHRSSLIPVKAGSYVFSLTNGYANGPKYVHGYDSNGTWVSLLAVDGNKSLGEIVNVAFTVSSNISFVCLVNQIADSNSQLTLGSTPQPYVPYGHVGMEAQGRNLIFKQIDGLAVSLGGIIANATAAKSYVAKVKPNTVYTLSRNGGNRFLIASIATSNPTNGTSCTIVKNETSTVSVSTFTSGTDEYVIATLTNGGDTPQDVQLELGTQATDYEPYFHTTTPIPLPQRGWVAGLPYGTADALRLDGAGKCEWTLPTSEVTYDGDTTTNMKFDAPYAGTSGVRFRSYNAIEDAVSVTSGDKTLAIRVTHGTPNINASLPESWVVGDSMLNGGRLYLVLPSSITTNELANTWLQSNPVTVLYPLATPIIEDCGYVDDWPTDIPEGATLSIRELDSVGIKYFIDSSVTELAKQWYARAYAELGDAVTELAGRVAALES